MAKNAATHGRDLIINDPLMCFLLAALINETEVHGRNILQKSKAKVRMTLVLCYPRKRLNSVPS
jgi:hypothetical protein